MPPYPEMCIRDSQNTMEKGIVHDRLKCDLWYGILQDNRINIGKKTDFARKTKILYFHVIGYMTDFITYRNNIFSLVQGQLVKIGERIYAVSYTHLHNRSGSFSAEALYQEFRRRKG